jgi:hypothetical protein
MAKKTKKLSVKKETLRKLDSLTEGELRQVGGGTDMAYSLVVPPKGTGGCNTVGCLLVYDINYAYYY